MTNERYLATEHVAFHRSPAQLRAGLADVAAAPKDAGTLALVVRRPGVGEREVLEVGVLDPLVGLVGDTWNVRSSTRTPDGSPHPDMQLNVMSSRAVALVAAVPERWPLAGDQLYVDLDLSPENLPPGTQLAIGSAVIEVTDQPHRGCATFAERFGVDALRFVNSPEGSALRMRGVNAKVVQAGEVRPGDPVTKR